MVKHNQGKHGKRDTASPSSPATPSASKPGRGRKVQVPRGVPSASPAPSSPAASGVPSASPSPAGTGSLPPQGTGAAPSQGTSVAPSQGTASPQGTIAMPPQGATPAPRKVASPRPGDGPRGAGPASPAAGGYVPSYQVNPEPPKGKKHRALKIFGIAAGAVLGAAALVYFAGVLIFMGRFFPHSSILDMDISGMTPEEVHEMLDGVLGDYSFKVEGHGLSMTLSAKDMGMTLDSRSIADNLLAQMDPWAWPYEIFQTHDDTEDLVSSFEETVLADTIQTAVDEANGRGTPPKDARVAFDGEAGAYVIVPEEEGDTILADVVFDEVIRGTVNFAPKVTLSDAVLAQPSITADDPVLAAARDEANKFLGGALSLTMAGKEVLAIDVAAIAERVKVADDLSVTFDAAPLVAMVKEKVNAMDTVGAERTYTRPDGKSFTVKGGDYGWITDSQATADEVQKALEAGEGGVIEIAMKQNAATSPDEHGRDFGGRFIDVDLGKQHAVLYDEDGTVLWESDIVSGLPSDGRGTPTGTYYLKTNDGKSVLRGYKPDGTKDYETEVTYWMPFKDNSVGFHDAGWQEKFGGDWYKEHGSHGCVNLPPDKAKELHEVVKVGDVVVVHE